MKLGGNHVFLAELCRFFCISRSSKNRVKRRGALRSIFAQTRPIFAQTKMA